MLNNPYIPMAWNGCHSNQQ